MMRPSTLVILNILLQNRIFLTSQRFLPFVCTSPAFIIFYISTLSQLSTSGPTCQIYLEARPPAPPPPPPFSLFLPPPSLLTPSAKLPAHAWQLHTVHDAVWRSK
jgi:hypothetical protein